MRLQHSGIVVVCFVSKRVLKTKVSFCGCIPGEIDVGYTWSGYCVSLEVSSVCWPEYCLGSHFCQSYRICCHSALLSAQLFGLWSTMCASATSLDP